MKAYIQYRIALCFHLEIPMLGLRRRRKRSGSFFEICIITSYFRTDHAQPSDENGEVDQTATEERLMAWLRDTTPAVDPPFTPTWQSLSLDQIRLFTVDGVQGQEFDSIYLFRESSVTASINWCSNYQTALSQKRP